MRKNFNKIIAILLCFVSLFLTACGDKTTAKEKEQIFSGGIHKYEVKETSEFIVKNGHSDYRIVIDKDADDSAVFAADEMQTLFLEATGISLPIINDESVGKGDGSKNIILGSNKLFEEAKIALDEEQLEKNGFLIKTKESNVYIGGATEDGTLFGVYGFLEQQFNFDCFSHDYYYIDDAKGKDVPLYDYDVLDVPDIMLRENGHDFMMRGNPTNNFRMRYTNRLDGNITVGSSSGHTSYLYLPTSIYNDASKPETYHPDWYSNPNTQSTEQKPVGQLCYTAHGNADEFELMMQTALEAAKNEFMKEEYKNGFIFHFMTEDSGSVCTCPTCNEDLQKYGTPTASIIKFVNELADRISEWMETEDGKPYARKFYVKIQAYQKTVPAPAKLNMTTGEYEPIDQSVVCNDRVAVEYSPGTLEYQKSIFDEANVSYYNVFKAWKACCKTLTAYTYTTNYYYSLLPYDTFNSQQTLYQFLAAQGVIYIFDLGQYGNTGATGWLLLKNYLCSKLAWDVNADVEYYTDKFFEYYYGEAKDSMREYYDNYRIYSKHMLDHGDLSAQNSIYGDFFNKKHWQKGAVSSWLESIESALEDIEIVKYYDSKRYQTLYNHITSERVSVYYMLISFYPEDYSAEQLLNMKLAVKEDCERLGIKTQAEGKPISNLWQTWGI